MEESLIRRVDEDRWLASRFAPTDIRVRLMAIYAVNYEIARTAEVVKEPAIGEIRLAWWREAIAEIHIGKPPRAHPALLAYAPLAAGLPVACWEALTIARAKDLEAAPFASWAQAENYVDNTAGGLMRLAIAACGGEVAHLEAFVRPATWAWGYLGLLRSAPFWAERGRSILPGSEAETRARALAGYQAAHAASPSLPAAMFPAIGYVALAPAYLRNPAPALITRQLRLVWASATGRV